MTETVADAVKSVLQTEFVDVGKVVRALHDAQRKHQAGTEVVNDLFTISFTLAKGLKQANQRIADIEKILAG